MTHLRIELNNGVIEEVNISLISKLYDIALSGLDSSSNLRGRLHASGAYRTQALYLTDAYPELYINVDKYYIEFEDPIVEQILMDELNLQGGVTIENVLSINKIYTGSTTGMFIDNPIGDIRYFDEYKYFTGISNSIGNVEPIYQGLLCPELIKVTFPKLSRELLRNASAVNLFGRKATKLLHVDWNGNISGSIPNGLYANCSSLVYSDGILMKGADYCSGAVFDKCTSLDKMIFYEGITAFGNGIFIDNTSLQYVEFPSTTAEMNNRTLFGGSTPSGLTVVMKAVTPPTVSDYLFMMNSGKTYNLYVPDNSVAAYKADNSWANVWTANGNNIYPLSQLPQQYVDMGTVTQEDIDRT